MKPRIFLGCFGFMFLLILVISQNAFATTDVSVYQSSKTGGGVSVGSLDAAGGVVDEQTVLVGQKVVGIRLGQPVPAPVAMTAAELNDGISKVEELQESEIDGQVDAKLNDLKRRIS